MRKKRPIYEHYFKRLTQAMAEEFYFEAAWIEYTMLEDRLLSHLVSTGGIPKARMTMGPKIDQLKKRAILATSPKWAAEMVSLFDRLKAWKDERDILMHSMVNGDLTIEEIDMRVKALVISGQPLTKEYSAVVMSAKKRR